MNTIDQPSGLRNPWIIPRYDPMPCKCPRCPAPPLMERSAVGLWVAIDDHIKEVNALRARAEQAEKDRDEARGYCDDLCWMMDRCHACGHRLRFEASGCPQCRAKAVAPWNEPKEMPDTCKCDRCAIARAGEVKP